MSESRNNPNVKTQMNELLKEVGLAPHLKGYEYVKTGLFLLLDDHNKMDGVTRAGGLYDTTAKEHSTTASRVERAVRHIIEVAFSTCPPDILYHLFGNAIPQNSGKPTNSMFFAALLNELELRLGV